MNIIGWTSRWSPELEIRDLEKLADSRRGAIDIGAAYGLYSWHLERICQKCIAFEPNPDSASRLSNALQRTEVFACALSDSRGGAVLRIPRKGAMRLTGFATIEQKKSRNKFTSFDEVSVRVDTLDSFGFKDIGFIKIDVEGHELPVLRGAEQTISHSQPVLLVELNDTNESNFEDHDVVTWLSERGYRRWHRRTSPQNFLFVPENP